MPGPVPATVPPDSGGGGLLALKQQHGGSRDPPTESQYEALCQRWSDKVMSSRSTDDRERNRYIADRLASVRQEYLTFHLLSSYKVLEVIENTQEMLGDLKAEGFSAPDHALVVQVLVGNIIAYVDRFLPSPLVAVGASSTLDAIAEKLAQCVEILARFCEVQGSGGSGVFQCDASVSATLAKVHARCGALYDVLMIFAHLFPSGQGATALLPLLADLPREDLMNGESSKWETSWERFDYQLQPYEQQLARTLLEDFEDDDTLLIWNWKQYLCVLRRPRIRQMLGVQLKLTMDHLQNELKQLEARIEVPWEYMADRLVWVHQALQSVREYDELAEHIGDRQSAYWARSKALQAALRDLRDALVSDWIADVEARQQELSLDKELLVLNFEDGKLHVMYTDEIGIFLSFARQVHALGHKLPPTVLKLAQDAQANLHTALMLRQIAQFYNTIDTEIFEFHKPLLLDSAVAFERLVQVQINWRDAKQVAQHVGNLSQQAGELRRKNDQLHAIHARFLHVIAGMLHLPSIAQYKAAVQEIEAGLSSLKWPADQLAAWRGHLQFQLLKVVQTNYARNLREFNIPELALDIVTKGGKVLLRPSIEEIKSKYYREVRRLLSQPLQVRGLVGGAAPSGVDVLDGYAAEILAIYRKAEASFDELDKKMQALSDWVTIGALNQEQLLDVVGRQCINIADWEAHFKTVKQKGKEVEQLPNVIKVDNLTCSLLPLKAAVDDFLQRLFDALVTTLNASVNAHVKQVQEFLANGRQLLSQIPTSVQDIAKARAAHGSIKTSDMQHHIGQIQAKQKFLRTVIGTATDLSELFTEFTQFEAIVSGHAMVIEDQFAQLQGQLEPRAEKVGGRIAALKDECAGATVQALNDLVERLGELEMQTDEVVRDFEFFGMSPPQFPELDECRQLIKKTMELREIQDKIAGSLEPVLETAVTSVQVDDLTRVVAQFREVLSGAKLSKALLEYHRQVDALAMLSAEWMSLFGEVKKFTPQHWSEFCVLLELPATTRITVRMLTQKLEPIKVKRDRLIDLGITAKNESVIRDSIQEVEMWSIACVIPLVEQSGVHMIREFKSLLTELCDQRAAVSSLQSAPNSKSFSELLGYWEKRLTDLDQSLRNLQIIQKKWVYLAPVITALSAAQQQKFSQVDSLYRDLMRATHKDPRIIQLLSFPNISALPGAVATLEICQKALIEFLEHKRSSFPRFYFIGDEDLLEILSQASSNPLVVQTHLKKLFSGLHKVVVENNCVTDILSALGEKVTLNHAIQITVNVDEWLSNLANEIQSTLTTLLHEYLTSPVSGKAYPEQIVDLAYRITMTQKIEAAIKQGTLADLLKTISYQSYEDIYYARVIQELMQSGIARVNDFGWLKVLRYYYNKNACVIRAFETEFAYSFDYQGNPAKLIQTPLTDTCFAILTQAMSEGLGGCLYGPAGTGKTESVKSLGYLFGRQVLVFNCDEGLDVASITRLFSGIVKCGAWGCFDEFNRLAEGVLAAVSNLVSSIQRALFEKSRRVHIGDNEVDVNPDACLFVTLNPVGKQYKGRRQLPNNLKQLFRNIAMTHPDITYICQIELKALGFEDSETLGKITFDFFDACKKILTPQRHYDWGLRALKAVLRTAANMAREKKTTPGRSVVAEAMRASTESKLTAKDLAVFQNLISIYFGATSSTDSSSTFVESLVASYKEAGLGVLDWQMKAAVDLHVACQQRIGVCIVGPPGSGKAALIKLVSATLNRMGKAVTPVFISPKAVGRQQLLGFMDPDTREWHDGVITKYSRDTVTNSEFHHLLVFDGDVDPEWIEALNSVLDDNRLLTMPNGERVKFENNVNFVFLTHSLDFASPATVSRLSIVYLDQIVPRKSPPSHELILGKLGTGRKASLAQKQGKKVWVQCTSETNSEHVVSALLNACTLNAGTSGMYLMPKGGGDLVMLVCDADLPKKDQYNSVELHQFLHQVIQYGGFYSPKTLEWIIVQPVKIICTAQNATLISPRVVTKLESSAMENTSADELSRRVLDQMRAAGIDTRHASRMSSVLGEMFAKTGNPLPIKKWLRSICPAGGFPSEVDILSLFAQIGPLVFPDNADLVRDRLSSEFGAGFGVISVPRETQESLEFTGLTSTTAFARFVSQATGAVMSACSVLHLVTRPGIPSLMALTTVAQNIGYTIGSVKYQKVATYVAFLQQLKDLVYTTGVLGKKHILVVESYCCPSPEYYHLLHDMTARSTMEILPDVSEAERDFEKSAYNGTLKEFVLERATSNMKLVLVNMPEPLLPGFPLFQSQSVTLKWSDWDQESMNALARNLPASLAPHLSTIYSEYAEREPSHFSQIVQLFPECEGHISSDLKERQKFLSAGLSNLVSTQKSVNKLSLEAQQQEKLVSDKQAQADKYLTQITDTMMQVSTQKTEMEQLKVSLAKEEVGMQDQRASIQKELAQVEPLLATAKSAVKDIKNEHLTEVRSLRAPPATVRDVLEGVLRLLGQQDTSWASMKTMLGKRTFKDDVLSFDAKAVTPSIRSQVDKLMKEKPESFVEANVRKSSVAAAPLAVWVTANLEFSRVMERIQPLQDKLNKVNATLDQSRKRIQELNEAVETVDQRVAQLKEDFGEKTKEAQQLAQVLEVTRGNLKRAQTLLESLASEEERWTLQLAEVNDKLSRTEPTALCCAMFCVWCPPLSEQERSAAVDQWKRKLGLLSFDFASLLGSTVRLEGVPTEDTITQENLIISFLNKGATFWVADGNGFGMDAVCSFMKPKVVSAQSDTYVKELEMAIRLGHVILLLDMSPSSVHTWLYPIIRKEFQILSGRRMISLGEKQFEVNDKFQLIVYSSFAAWNVTRELLGPTSKLTWSTTYESLSANLLRVIMTQDAPELLKQMESVVSQEKGLRQQLVEVETHLLRELSSAQGDILSNQVLFDSLMQAKSQGKVLSESLEQSKVLKEQLRGQQQLYADTMRITTSQYFLVRKLSELHPHYRFPLKLFTSWFEEIVAQHPVGADGAAQMHIRLRKMLQSFTRAVYQKVTLGIDVSHHLTFGIALLQTSGVISSDEISALLGLSGPSQGASGAPLPEWIPADRRDELRRLDGVVDLRLLQTESTKWTKWLRGDTQSISTPASEGGPANDARVSEMAAVLLTQALIPDRLTRAMRHLVDEYLGSSAAIDLPGLVSKALKRPVMLFVHPGADPVALMGDLLKKAGSNLADATVVSLGAGQDNVASEALVKAMEVGSLLFVQNLQASPSWIATCLAALGKVNEAATAFRLVMSCEANTITLPVELLELCHLVNVQVTTGFVKNVSRSWESLVLKDIRPKRENSTSKPEVTLRDVQTAFLVTWLHIIVQERGRFIPQAWRKYYEFSDRDFISSIRSVFFGENDGAGDSSRDLSALRGLVSLIYGGRIDSVDDVLKLRLLIRLYLLEDLLAGGNPTPASPSVLRTPGKTQLLRGFSLPLSLEPKEYITELEKAFGTSDVKEDVLFQLPPNIANSVDSITSRNILFGIKLLVVGERANSGQHGNAQSSSPAPEGQSRTKSPTGASSSRSSVDSLITLWKQSVVPSKPLQADSSKLTCPLSRYLASQYEELLLRIARISCDLGSCVKNQNSSLLSAIRLSTTPDEWTDLVPQFNLLQFVTDLAQKIASLADHVTAIERAFVDKAYVRDPMDIALSCMPVCAGFFCVAQQMVAELGVMDTAGGAAGGVPPPSEGGPRRPRPASAISPAAAAAARAPPPPLPTRAIGVHQLCAVGAFSLEALRALPCCAPLFCLRALYLQGAIVSAGSRLAPVTDPCGSSRLPVTLYLAYILQDAVPRSALPPDVVGTAAPGGPASAGGGDGGPSSPGPPSARRELRTIPIPLYSEIARETLVSTISVVIEDPGIAPSLLLAGAALFIHNL